MRPVNLVPSGAFTDLSTQGAPPKAGANVNAIEEDGMRPLHFAAQAGELEVCQLLVLMLSMARPALGPLSEP